MIAIVGTPQSAITENGQNITLTFDVVPSEGDIVLVFGGHGSATTTLAPPGVGYTLIAENTGVAPIFGAWYKRMVSTPDTSVLCDGGGNGFDSVAYGCYVLSGVDDAVLDVPVEVLGPSNPAEIPPPITTITADSWVMPFTAKNNTDNTVGIPAGYLDLVTKAGADTNDITIAGSRKEIAVPGLETPGKYGTWNIADAYMITLALRTGTYTPPVVGGRSSPGLSLGLIGKMGA
jgi:hypothetical protein